MCMCMCVCVCVCVCVCLSVCLSSSPNCSGVARWRLSSHHYNFFILIFVLIILINFKILRNSYREYPQDNYRRLSVSQSPIYCPFCVFVSLLLCILFVIFPPISSLCSKGKKVIWYHIINVANYFMN